MSTLSPFLEEARIPKTGCSERRLGARRQRCNVNLPGQAGGQKKNPEMQQCGVVPKGANISYAPRLTVTAPSTRGGPEMVSSDQFMKNPPIPKTYRLQVEEKQPRERRASGTRPGTRRGLRNRSAAPGNQPARQTRGNTTVTTPPRGISGKHTILNTPFAL